MCLILITDLFNRFLKFHKNIPPKIVLPFYNRFSYLNELYLTILPFYPIQLMSYLSLSSFPIPFNHSFPKLDWSPGKSNFFSNLSYFHTDLSNIRRIQNHIWHYWWTDPTFPYPCTVPFCELLNHYYIIKFLPPVAIFINVLIKFWSTIFW